MFTSNFETDCPSLSTDRKHTVANIALGFFFALATIIAVTAATSTAVPSTAGAAEVETVPANSQPIAHFQTLQYFALPWDDVWVARVTAEIADFENLPAVIEIAVPAQSAVYFFGDGENNSFPAPFSMRTENGLDIYTGLLTESRIVNIEYTMNASPAGPGPAMNLSYTPIHDVDELQLISALPLGSAVIDPEFEDMGTGPDGEPAFALFIENAVGGTTYDASIPYIMTTDGPSPNNNPMVLVGLVAFLVIVAGAVIFIFMRRNKQED